MPADQTFDLRTHATDPATQQTRAVNLYTLYILGGTKYFERPMHSGNLFYENNEPAGRITGFDGAALPIIKKGEPHIDYVAPPSGAEKIAAELSDAKAALEAAKAELAAIKGEQELKATAAAKPVKKAQAKAETPKDEKKDDAL